MPQLTELQAGEFINFVTNVLAFGLPAAAALGSGSRFAAPHC
ncbi:MAG: hypothetical protein AAGF11_25440 [Myxococcota bacterium]